MLRQGRISNAQRRAYAELLPVYGVAFSSAPLDLDRLFGRAAPNILEIGFGMGETTAAIAQQHPENDYLGVEVHTPGVGSLLARVAELRLANVRVIQHDAVEVLERMFAPAALDAVLMNTAVAKARNPVLMAQAMKKAVEAGREAFLAGRMPKKLYSASPSSPAAGLISPKAA